MEKGPTLMRISLLCTPAGSIFTSAQVNSRVSVYVSTRRGCSLTPAVQRWSGRYKDAGDRPSTVGDWSRLKSARSSARCQHDKRGKVRLSPSRLCSGINVRSNRVDSDDL